MLDIKKLLWKRRNNQSNKAVREYQVKRIECILNEGHYKAKTKTVSNGFQFGK